MSDKQEFVSYTMTAPGLIAFHNLMEKKASRPGYREQWDLTLELDADHLDLAPIKKLVVAEFKKGAPSIDIKDKRNWARPWETGEEFIERMKEKARTEGTKEYDNEHLRGKVLLKSHALTKAPALGVMQNKQVVPYEGEGRARCADKFYSGCEVLAEFNVKYYKVGTALPGVTLYLNSVLSLNKGEKRGGARDVRETFSAYAGRVSGENPTDDDNVDY